jgi:ATP-binding cassette subfamily G (WHITE) protein 2 (SNQ2)
LGVDGGFLDCKLLNPSEACFSQVYPIHFGQGSAGTNGTGFQLVVIMITELFAVSLGQLIASITPSIQIAALFTSPVSIILTNICGVTVPYPTLGKFWRDWLYQLDPFTRMVGAMLATELQYVQCLVLSSLCAKRFWYCSGLKITCKPEEFTTFNPPSSQTCAAWASDFVNAAGGYLDNPNDSTACRYCKYSVSDIDK